PVTGLPREPSLPLIPATHDATSAATGRSKILIVDDEPFNVDYLEQELEELGYDTISAANGQEALEKVAAEAPDLILLDVLLPVLDGFTGCSMLNDHEATSLTLLIIMRATEAEAETY